MPLFSFLFISWWCGLLVPCVGLYPVLCVKSGGRKKTYLCLLTHSLMLMLNVYYEIIVGRN